MKRGKSSYYGRICQGIRKRKIRKIENQEINKSGIDKIRIRRDLEKKNQEKY
jgi:hypothetical protein